MKKNKKFDGYAVSENDLDVMAAKAYELTGSMNQLLKDANASNNIQLREENLLEIRAQLKEIKNICKKIPQFHTIGLDGFEASIEGVASETSDLKKENRKQEKEALALEKQRNKIQKEEEKLKVQKALQDKRKAVEQEKEKNIFYAKTSNDMFVERCVARKNLRLAVIREVHK